MRLTVKLGQTANIFPRINADTRINTHTSAYLADQCVIVPVVWPAYVGPANHPFKKYNSKDPIMPLGGRLVL